MMPTPAEHVAAARKIAENFKTSEFEKLALAAHSANSTYDWEIYETVAHQMAMIAAFDLFPGDGE